MQFIEKNSLNVRSAIYHLIKDGAGLEFVLFPMIHVGSQEFYAEVSRRLAACDLVLAEGVRSRKVRLLTLSYRVVKWIKRMDLVTQREGMDVASFRNKMLNSDMAGAAFDERWGALPLKFRALLFLCLPLYVVNLFLFGTRETLAENIALEDLPSSEEILSQDDDFEQYQMLLLDERDQTLIGHIEKLAHSDQHARKIVGIVYGAGHMRNVIDFLLRKLNYRVAKAEWVTVFDL
jgi:hypothetical protein